MKIILTLIMCSYVQSTCLPQYEWPTQFDDMYDCMQAGYKESIKKIGEVGRKDVNEHKIFIRFACVEEQNADI